LETPAHPRLPDADPLQRDRRPLPLQLRDRMIAAIREDGLRPGDRVPPEVELVKRFQVGRSTVREAVKLLERDGVVRVRHGVGSFVSAVAQLGAERPITQLEGVTEMMGHLGYTVENRVLRVEEREPTDAERAALALPAGALVVDLERLRMHRCAPFVYSLNVFARDLFESPSLDDVDWGESLLGMLEASGCPAVTSVAQIHAVEPPDRLRELAPDFADEPWLLIAETCVDAVGRPILIARDYHRGDAFAFHVVRQPSLDDRS
jgi:GntR family transcriptional regulator